MADDPDQSVEAAMHLLQEEFKGLSPDDPKIFVQPNPTIPAACADALPTLEAAATMKISDIVKLSQEVESRALHINNGALPTYWQEYHSFSRHSSHYVLTMRKKKLTYQCWVSTFSSTSRTLLISTRASSFSALFRFYRPVRSSLAVVLSSATKPFSMPYLNLRMISSRMSLCLEDDQGYNTRPISSGRLLPQEVSASSPLRRVCSCS
jgi:hypothetical protein